MKNRRLEDIMKRMTHHLVLFLSLLMVSSFASAHKTKCRDLIYNESHSPDFKTMRACKVCEFVTPKNFPMSHIYSATTRFHRRLMNRKGLRSQLAKHNRYSKIIIEDFVSIHDEKMFTGLVKRSKVRVTSASQMMGQHGGKTRVQLTRLFQPTKIKRKRMKRAEFSLTAYKNQFGNLESTSCMIMETESSFKNILLKHALVHELNTEMEIWHHELIKDPF